MTLAAGEHVRLPRTYRGRDIFWWLQATGLLAERYDYFAGKEPDQKKANYNRLDAARARGWAARLRGGWTAPVADRIADEAQTEPTW